MKKYFKEFITSLKPAYAVEVTIYHLIPGQKVSAHSEKHQFEKGEYDKARDFYQKVLKKNAEIKLVPAEVKLIRGTKRVKERMLFGPVEELKKLKMSA